MKRGNSPTFKSPLKMNQDLYRDKLYSKQYLIEEDEKNDEEDQLKSVFNSSNTQNAQAMSKTEINSPSS